MLEEGEPASSPRALAQAGPLPAVAFHDLVEKYDSLRGSEGLAHFPFAKQLEAYRTVYQAYEPAEERHLMNHRGHMMALRPDETHIDGDIIAAITLTGTHDALVERVRGIRDAGYHQLAISLATGHEDDMLQRWSDVFAAL